MRIGDIGEFGLIERLAAILGPTDASVVVGIGDDAAVTAYAERAQVVTTTDMLVEGVHFRTDTIPDRELGWKAVAVSLSDIAAMGGRPKHVLLSLAIPPTRDVERLEELYRGIGDVCQTYGAHVIGGDVVKTDGPFVLSVTVLGEVEHGQALLRSTAQPGDLVFVTGTVGGSAAGLHLVQQADAPASDVRNSLDEAERGALLRFHQRPEPQVLAGQLLRTSGACTSANDVSDGVASESHEIAKMSRVQLVLEADKLPIHASVRRYAARIGRDPVEWALFGGEDYQLIGTVRASEHARVEALFAAQGLSFTVIGRAIAGAGVTLLRNGTEHPLAPTGYNHFRE